MMRNLWTTAKYLLLLAALLALPATAAAQVNVGLVGSGGTTTQVNANLGASDIRIDINLDASTATVTMMLFELTIPTDVVSSYRLEVGSVLRPGRIIDSSPISATATTETFRGLVYGTDDKSLLAANTDGFDGATAKKGSSLLKVYLQINATAPVGNKTITLAGLSAVDSTGATVTLNNALPSVVLAVEALPIAGNVNGDTLFNAQDVESLVKSVLGTQGSSTELAAADVNRDGVVNVNDLQLAVNALLGRPTIFQMLPNNAARSATVTVHGANLTLPGLSFEFANDTGGVSTATGVAGTNSVAVTVPPDTAVGVGYMTVKATVAGKTLQGSAKLTINP